MTKTLTIYGESRLLFIDRVAAASRTFLREEGFADEVSERVGLAVAEAVSNAIRHGNGGIPRRRVEVTFVSQDERLTVSVRDEGPGFDPTREEAPVLAAGRGVQRMRELMDSVQFSTHPRGGGVVHLSKQK